MLGAWLGALLLVLLLELLSLLSPGDTQTALLQGLLAATFMLGGALVHEQWSGGSVGALLLDGAFNFLGLPLAAVLLRTLQAYV